MKSTKSGNIQDGDKLVEAVVTSVTLPTSSFRLSFNKHM